MCFATLVNDSAVPGGHEVVLELDGETESEELQTDLLQAPVGLRVDLDGRRGRTPAEQTTRVTTTATSRNNSSDSRSKNPGKR